MHEHQADFHFHANIDLKQIMVCVLACAVMSGLHFNIVDFETFIYCHHRGGD